MRANSSVILRGRSVWLVPYRREHIPTYHGWMQRPELLEQTYALNCSNDNTCADSAVASDRL